MFKNILKTIIFCCVFLVVNPVHASWQQGECFYVRFYSDHYQGSYTSIITYDTIHQDPENDASMWIESTTTTGTSTVRNIGYFDHYYWFSEQWILANHQYVSYSSITVDYETLGPNAKYPDGCPPPPVCDPGELLPGLSVVDGKWPEISCIDECEYIPGGAAEDGWSMYSFDSLKTTYFNMVSTGENCVLGDGSSPGVNDPLEDDPPNDSPYPLVEIDSVIYPDQDMDDIPSGNDPDVDGDGDSNINDGDVDGDGDPNSLDTDVDGDAISNGGETGDWVYDNPTTPGSGGIGADPDVDGDDITNGFDGDIDGDGWLNDDDGDMDGDGVKNQDDGDIDGDGNLNDVDGTPWGISTGDGVADTGDGTGLVDGGDGTSPEPGEGDNEDDTTESPPGEGDNIDAAVCPAGQVCIGDGICQSGESVTSADCAGENFFQDRFQTFTDNIKATGLFQMTDGIAGIPSGGSSIKSVDLGNWGGVQEFDFADFNYVWSILSAVFTIGFLWIGVKIVTLKHT